MQANPGVCEESDWRRATRICATAWVLGMFLFLAIFCLADWVCPPHRVFLRAALIKTVVMVPATLVLSAFCRRLDGRKL